MGQLNYNELLEFRKQFITFERSWAKTQKVLLELPAKLGFASVEDLVKALRNAESGNKNGVSEAMKNKPRRRRQIITPQIRAMVKQLIAAGKTSAHIAEKAEISIPTVHNIKKQLGLVSPRAKKS